MTVLPLLATLAALSCGPLLYAFARPRPAVLAFLDGFVLVSIAGLVLLEVVPGAYGEGGAWSLGFLALGAIGPSLVEHGLHHARRKAHLATLALAILGLLLHSIGDGVALAPGHGGDHAHHAHDALAIAVIVHSVPVGLVVWWVMAPVFGPRWPAVTLALMCAGTVAGYVFGLELNAVIGERAFAWFQALVAGSILHVVFGRPHLEEDSEHRDAPPPYEGLGNLAAVAGLIALDRLNPHADALYAFLDRAWSLGLSLAPWVLMVYLLLGILRTGFPFVVSLSNHGRETPRRRGPTRAPFDKLRANGDRHWPSLGGYVSPGTSWKRLCGVLRRSLVEWIDRSAVLLLIALAVLTAWAGRWSPEPVLWVPMGRPIHLLSLELLALAFLLSLLRCGGRRWVTQPFGGGHVHSH